MAEAAVVKAIMDKITLLFMPTTKGAWAKHSPSSWSPSGYPDITGAGCFSTWDGRLTLEEGGRFVAIECKNENYKNNPMRGLSPDQFARLRDITQAGGVALVANQRPHLALLGGYRLDERRWALHAWLLKIEGGHYSWEHGLVADGLWFPNGNSTELMDSRDYPAEKVGANSG